MSPKMVVVSGTGTGIGKTHLGEALLLALGALRVRAAGVKPVETGYADPEASDATRLARASPFHVKHAGLRYADPVSPHIAAREAGRPIAIDAIRREVLEAATAAERLLVELAGGLFSPLSDTETNADLVRALRPDVHLLVAPDRLGVLHDLVAATRAAAAEGLRIDGVVLIAPPEADSSTGRNAPEVTRLTGVALWACVPRGAPRALAADPGVQDLARRMQP